jgi:hypothetical protein
MGRFLSGRHRRGRIGRKPFERFPPSSKAPPRRLGSGSGDSDGNRSGPVSGADRLRRELHRLLHSGRRGEDEEDLSNQPSRNIIKLF